ncbi:hypothetical protein SNE40_010584 [Patella caerulea]|uniref:Arsenite methyltransferase n=1 Tax=Patella caerulea TaxID=87958 RepID=A0AAN8Q568_PATCE
MTEHELTTAVKNFYNDLAINTNLVSVVNKNQLSQKYNELISQLHPEIMKRYYGSGFFIPEKLGGLKVLDMGCGSGSLVYILSKLVGKDGFVNGVDITPNLILEPKKHSNYHKELWGYTEANFEFKVCNIEQFDDLGFKEQEFDVIVCNGVICVCPDQEIVFKNANRLLKDGGEFCLSDVYADRPRPAEAMADSKLFSLGTTGSMLIEELNRLCELGGFSKPYLKGAAPVEFKNMEIHESVNKVQLACAEWRLFKMPPGARRSAAEVTYNGNIFGFEDTFNWDVTTEFKTGQPVTVDVELASILYTTRFRDSFNFKDINAPVTTPRFQNPYTYLDELRTRGGEVEYAYTI